MSVELLTPLGALLALAAVVPLAVYVLRERRAHQIRHALRLSGPGTRARVPLLAALVAVPALLGMAAAQPVVAQTRTLPERTDAQVFVAIDISRSMLASGSADSPTRFDRAKQIALDLRADLPDLPMGIASMTLGLLPHLFPTTDARVYSATLDNALNVGLVWTGLGGTIATSLDAIGAAPRLNYFPPEIEKRVLVVLTDGESQPLQRDLSTDFQTDPRVETIFVHVWREGEKVFLSGVPEASYVQDTASRATLERVVSQIEGTLLDESDAGALASRVRSLVGTGPTVDEEVEGERLALMPYIALLTIVPLGFVLVRRNV